MELEDILQGGERGGPYANGAAGGDQAALLEFDGTRRTGTAGAGDLARDVSACAAWLARRDIGRGSTVAILAGLNRFALAAILACLERGALAVPLSPELPAPQLMRTLEGLRPACCIVAAQAGPKELALLRESRLRTLSAGEWPGSPPLDAPGGRPAAAPPAGDLDETLPALLILSSGSSGRPKEILYSRRQLRVFMAHHDFLYRQFSDLPGRAQYASPLLATLPLSHLGGLGFCLQALLMRRPLLLLRRFTPADYWQLVCQWRVRLCMLVPGMYARILALPDLRADSELRFCLSVGEPMPRSLARRIRRCLKAGVFSAYGLSECETGLGHAREQVERGTVPPGSCGRHLFGEVRLVDTNGRCDAGEGELWVRNPTVFPCYRDPAMNREKLCDGWFRTGDVLRRDNDGYYYYCGRGDDMFIVNGKNLYPAQIEQVVREHGAVEGCAAVPLFDRRGQALPGVLVQCAGGASIAADELADHCLAHGPLFATPGWIGFVSRLPLLDNGKVDRAACRRALQADFDGQRGANGGPAPYGMENGHECQA